MRALGPVHPGTGWSASWGHGGVRVLLGVHFPTDVLAGAALGPLWVAVAVLVVPYLPRRASADA